MRRRLERECGAPNASPPASAVAGRYRSRSPLRRSATDQAPSRRRRARRPRLPERAHSSCDGPSHGRLAGHMADRCNACDRRKAENARVEMCILGKDFTEPVPRMIVDEVCPEREDLVDLDDVIGRWFHVSWSLKGEGVRIRDRGEKADAAFSGRNIPVSLNGPAHAGLSKRGAAGRHQLIGPLVLKNWPVGPASSSKAYLTGA